jgi:hypothetical protein
VVEVVNGNTTFFIRITLSGYSFAEAPFRCGDTIMDVIGTRSRYVYRGRRNITHGCCELYEMVYYLSPYTEAKA